MSLNKLAEESALEELRPGDLVQLSFNGEEYQHTPVVVRARNARTPAEVLVAAHSEDADNRPLATYDYRLLRCLHITGIVYP